VEYATPLRCIGAVLEWPRRCIGAALSGQTRLPLSPVWLRVYRRCLPAGSAYWRLEAGPQHGAATSFAGPDAWA